MISHYKITDRGVKDGNSYDYNWLLVESPSEQEVAGLRQRFDLPQDIFDAIHYPEEVSRVEILQSKILKNALSVIAIDLQKGSSKYVEDRLHPVSFVLLEDLLITITSGQSNLVDRIIEYEEKEINCTSKVLAFCLLFIYTNYVEELRGLKKIIDDLDRSARKTTENEELFKLADLERNIVFIEKTVDDQQETMHELWQNDQFIQQVDDPELIYDIQIKHRQASKLSHIYRDLIDTVGGLFTDMMDNNLNHLMKYLDSAALVISIPALIAGIWGMNTGGLPGEGTRIGFFAVIILAVILAVIAAVYLNKKDFTK
jgi:magnesium transporter